MTAMAGVAASRLVGELGRVRLGRRFEDPNLLVEAMTHPSVPPDKRGHARHGYERLEFLGDRVLGLVMAEWLLEHFPREAEGRVAKRFATLVSKPTLADRARGVGLGEFLILGQGEEETGGRENEANLANACEALIGALYLDGGLEPARAFIRDRWAGLIDRDARPPQDPKTALQEWAQARALGRPEYRVVGQSGPDHAPSFEIEVEVEGRGAMRASAGSKREAEKRAAAALLERVTADWR